MRIEPVGVLIIRCFIPDNRVLPSFFYAFILPSHRECRSFLRGEGKRGRKRDDDVLLSSYLWRIIRGTNFSTREKSTSVFLIPSTFPNFSKKFLARGAPRAILTHYFAGSEVRVSLARQGSLRLAAAANDATSRGDHNEEKGLRSALSQFNRRSVRRLRRQRR